jgi:hypothetical protein
MKAYYFNRYVYTLCAYWIDPIGVFAQFALVMGLSTVEEPGAGSKIS